jgi:hypothetical protein
VADSPPEFLAFFKALADETRLKIVGLLAREPYSGEQLALLLEVKPATISHHLAKLAEAGLVRAEMEGHAKMYALRLDAIHATAKRLLAQDILPQTAAEVDLEAYDRKVIKDFTKRDGSLKQIPAQEKKLQALLKHMLKEFEPGREYAEKEVNTILARYHEDTASLRRAMIEYKLMKRASGKYWRAASRGG